MPFQEISIEELKTLQAKQEINLVDIRDPASFAQGHIPHARRIDNENLEAFIANADKAKPLVVCCYHGISSQGAAEFLNQRGFSEAYSLSGGYAAWEALQDR